jgi:crotonobetainyl-CoA:carnitine CoA-transferase CaiB-like acyl-CoA transferase
MVHLVTKAVQLLLAFSGGICMSAAPAPMKAPSFARPAVLRGVRIVSLALNLPGPAALWRLRAMGARCLKIEPPSGDPMANYSLAAYQAMHSGLPTRTLDLKTPRGQAALRRQLARTDVLLTSFRPSALAKLDLVPAVLQQAFPGLSCITIVGAAGAAAETPGHDLTYQAEVGLVPGLSLPPSLLADMGGALATSEAVLQAVLAQRQSGRGIVREVALAGSAQWLAWPLTWGLTGTGDLLGGGHAGYRVYPCRDGRVAVAALEPHFALRLCQQAGVSLASPADMLLPAVHAAIGAWLATRSRRQLARLALQHDLPLHPLPA